MGSEMAGIFALGDVEIQLNLVSEMPQPVRVIFNNPATIVFWDDGEKTIVKCDNDEFCEEFGFAMAYMRKIYGSRSAFKKALGRIAERQDA